MFDIAIIGGGVNGCGIARDAAGRGLKVLLVEQNDLANGTSAASTKLIHGGLRYLEYYEFGLVRHALKEREVLWAMAPHIIWPLRFVLPHHKGLRPAFLIRLGLFLYDHMGGRKLLPTSRTINLRTDPAGGPLKNDFVKAFEYSDCWVEDARLVVLNAMDAAARGADIRVRTKLVSAQRQEDHWRLELLDKKTNQTHSIDAGIMINAAGPWVSDVAQKKLRRNSRSNVRLVKGSHIVVPRLFDHERAYIFQNTDNRIMFAIPYERDFTLIGTTDVDFNDDPADVKISPIEIDYLCAAASAYFKKPVSPDDVSWTYSGVRPLFDDGEESAQELTRDFVLELDEAQDRPALLNIFGGKITTYRHLAEEALAKLEHLLPRQKSGEWTRGAPLPGGDFPVTGFSALVHEFRQSCPLLEPDNAARLVRAYGTLAAPIFAGVFQTSDLGVDFGGGLFQPEVEYLVKNEWARSADDILWRRSKLGLRLSKPQAAALQNWLQDHLAEMLQPTS